jgi:hypothetical protein
VPLLWVGCDNSLFEPDSASIAQPAELPPHHHYWQGTFQGVVVHDNRGDMIYIANGRFDYDWVNRIYLFKLFWFCCGFVYL